MYLDFWGAVAEGFAADHHVGGGLYGTQVPQPFQAYVSVRQHTSACVSIRQVSVRHAGSGALPSIRQHTSACVSICQHASAYVSIRQVSVWRGGSGALPSSGNSSLSRHKTYCDEALRHTPMRLSDMLL